MTRAYSVLQKQALTVSGCSALTALQRNTAAMEHTNVNDAAQKTLTATQQVVYNMLRDMKIMLGDILAFATLGRILAWYEQQDEWVFRHDVLEQIVLWTGYLCSYGYVVYRAFTGSIGAGNFVLYFNAVSLLSNTVHNLADHYSGFKWQSDNVSYEREYCDIPDKTNRDFAQAVKLSLLR